MSISKVTGSEGEIVNVSVLFSKSSPLRAVPFIADAAKTRNHE